jgi:hypothetical protein
MEHCAWSAEQRRNRAKADGAKGIEAGAEEPDAHLQSREADTEGNPRDQQPSAVTSRSDDSTLDRSPSTIRITSASSSTIPVAARAGRSSAGT